MIEYKIEDEDLLRLLNSYKDEINYLKAVNDDLRGEIAYLKSQIADNQKRNLPTIAQDDNFDLAKQKYEQATKLFNENDYEGAIKLYNEAIELNQNNDYAYYMLGLVYYLLGKYNLAIDDFTKALEIYPNYKSAYNWRGKCYQALGDNKKAQADFAKAKELGYEG